MIFLFVCMHINSCNLGPCDINFIQWSPPSQFPKPTEVDSLST